jgi:hypothetical protein
LVLDGTNNVIVVGKAYYGTYYYLPKMKLALCWFSLFGSERERERMKWFSLGVFWVFFSFVGVGDEMGNKI